MARSRREQGEQTREAIVEVTARLFATRGYAGTSLEEVAREADTSKSSIFWHFANKEELLFTVVDRAMGAWEARAAEEILAQPDPPRRMARLVELYRELAEARPDTLRLLLGLLLETADTDAGIRRRFGRMYEGYRASIRLVLDEGVRGGWFRDDLPREQLPAMLLALFDGLFVQRFLDRDAVTPAVDDAVQRAVFALLMPGQPVPTPARPDPGPRAQG